jgi:hypothetical protein
MIDSRDTGHGACSARHSLASVATGISKSLLCGGGTALVGSGVDTPWRRTPAMAAMAAMGWEDGGDVEHERLPAITL